MKKQALGRGLNALINTEEVKTEGSTNINEIDIELIEANPNQLLWHVLGKARGFAFCRGFFSYHPVLPRLAARSVARGSPSQA